MTPARDWWPGSPPRVTSAAIAQVRADPTRAGDLLARAAGVGAVVEGEGPEREVTFVHRATPEAPECAVVLDTITDTHRADLTPMRLDPLPGTDVLAAAFRLPSDLRVTCSWWAGTALDLRAGRDRDGWRSVLAACRPAPDASDVVANAHGGAGSVLALPDAAPEPWSAPRPEVPGGDLTPLAIPSTHLHRAVEGHVHVPAGVDGPFALAVLLDGDMWTQVRPFAPTLDALHADGVIHPTVTVFVDSGPRDLRFAELGLSPAFPAFLADELVPHLRARFPLVDDPSRHVVAGQSLGGLAAAQVVHARPDTFAAALVQSGSFWWPDEDAPGELTRRYADDPPPRGVRIVHEVGRFENQLLDVNREFRDVARASGVDVTYREVAGGHDYASWRAGLADGLALLLAA